MSKYAILWFLIAVSSPSFAEMRFNQGPVRHNQFHYKRTDPKTNTVTTYLQYQSWDRFYGWVTYTEVVSTERLPASPPTIAAKKLEKPAAPPKSEAPPKPQLPIVPSLAPLELEMAPVIPQTSFGPVKVDPIERHPLRLVTNLPAAASSVDWGKKLSAEKREEMAELVRRNRTNVVLWQNDFLSRFSKCFAGFCEAARTGTFEKLTVPYQVAMGRVRLLKVESDYLVHLLKETDTDEQELIRLFLLSVRRFEALQFLLEETAGEQHRPYHSNLTRDLEDLQNMGKQWDAFQDAPDSKVWVLRWQLLAQDLQLWLEKVEAVREIVDTKLKQKLTKAEAKLRKALDEIGNSPWTQDLESQAAMAVSAYQACTELFHDYPAIAAAADRIDQKADSYLSTIAFLGANESLRVYAKTIETSAKPAPAEED